MDSQLEIQTQPHSVEAEEGAIACVLMEDGGSTADRYIELGLLSDHFYVESNKVIWEAILSMRADGLEVDEILLFERLKKSGRHEDVPLQSIYRIQDRVQTNLHAKHFAEIIIEKAKLRIAIRMSREAIEAAYKEGTESGEIFSSIDKKIQSATESGQSDFDLMGCLKQARDELTTRSMEMVIPVGIPSYDSSLTDGGLKPGQVMVLAARPGRGKTTLALNIAGRNLSNWNGVGIFSLEMSSIELVKKMVCMKSQCDFDRFKDNIQTPSEQERFDIATAQMTKWNLQIDDRTNITPSQIKARARMWKRKHQVSLIIIDYLQLIQGTNPKSQREEQVADISRNVKLLAKELEIPVILLAQLNRECEKENRAPRLTDLRESGAIEQDADIVTFLYTKKEDVGADGRSSKLRWNRPKQRNGPPDSFGTLIFNGKMGVIHD